MVRHAQGSRSRPGDGRTLSSILSLAAGAGVLSAGGQADADLIVTQSFGPVTVGLGAGQDRSWSFNLLPGTVGDLQIKASSSEDQAFIKALGTAATGISFGGQSSRRTFTTSAGNNVAFRTAAGVSASALTPNWNASERKSSLPAAIIVSSVFKKNSAIVPYTYQWKGVGPGGFSDKYLLFTFTNTDLSATNYGWIHLVSATRSVGDKTGMSVTIDGLAYRTDGQPIGAGQTLVRVPEIDPGAATGALALAAGALSLLEQSRLRGAGEAMGGALVSGAAGLRRWRKARADAARQTAPAA